MDRAAYGQDLLYVSNTGADVYVFTYPQGQLVGTLTGFVSALGECVDSAGDVFIVTLANKSGSSSIIYEYAHGGTAAVATLIDEAGAEGCAIDPTSGNLAVADWADSKNPYGHFGAVAVYAGAQGKPTMYYSSEFVSFGLCGYDPKGNLYLSGTNGEYGNQDQLARLSSGSGQLQQISLDVKLYDNGGPPSVQWDGQYLTVSSFVSKQPQDVYRLRISGTNATIAGTTMLSSRRNNFRTSELWIQAKGVLGSDFFKGHGGVDLWSYPSGGKARAILSNKDNLFPFGIVVSPTSSE